MRGLLVVLCLSAACGDEDCAPGSRRCTHEGVEECVIDHCSLVASNASWVLSLRCEPDEMCTTEGCASPDGGTRDAQPQYGEDCSIH